MSGRHAALEGRNPKWRARYEQIVDTSAAVIAQRGYHATGINELCVANDLGKGAFYHYIGSKEDLLVAINDRVLDVVIERAGRVDARGGTASERLRNLGDDLISVISEYPHHVWVTLHDFLALTNERAAHVRERRREYEAFVERILRDGIGSGEFRAVDVRVTTLAWIGMYNFTYRWMSTDGGRTADRVAETFSEIFLRGLAPSPTPSPTPSPATRPTTRPSTRPSTRPGPSAHPVSRRQRFRPNFPVCVSAQTDPRFVRLHKRLGWAIWVDWRGG